MKKVESAEIISADWKNDLGRGSDQFGLQLVIQTDIWTSCAVFGIEAGRRVLSGCGVNATQDLVGRWCVVEAGIGMSEVKYLGPISPTEI